MCADLFDELESEKPAPTKAGTGNKGASAGEVGRSNADTSPAPVTPGAQQRTHYCSRCRSPMRRIVGKMGPFWGCTAYPACDKKLYDLDGQPSDTPDERYRCPVCTRPLVRAEAKADAGTEGRIGDVYWYCTGYNKGCKVTLPDDNGKPADAWRCPRCGHLLKQRRGKNGLFWGCSQYPLCTASFTDMGGKPKGSGFE